VVLLLLLMKTVNETIFSNQTCQRSLTQLLVVLPCD